MSTAPQVAAMEILTDLVVKLHEQHRIALASVDGHRGDDTLHHRWRADAYEVAAVMAETARSDIRHAFRQAEQGELANA